MSAPTPPPAGWFVDPAGSGRQRWWDGAQWTEHYREALPPAPPPAAAPATPSAAAPAPGQPSPTPGAGGQPATPPARPRRRWLLPVLIVVPLAVVAILAVVAALLIPRLLGGGERQFTADQAQAALLDSSELDASSYSPLAVAAVPDPKSVVPEDLSSYLEPFTDDRAVSPPDCAGPTGYAGFVGFDEPSYRGWTKDTVLNYTENGSAQLVRRFVDADAAKQFVALQRDWYTRCDAVQYGDGADESSYRVTPLSAPSGIDGVVAYVSYRYTESDGTEQTINGVDIYERRGNLVLILGTLAPSGASQDDASTAGEHLAADAAKRLNAL